jgi:hypothetical protein
MKNSCKWMRKRDPKNSLIQRQILKEISYKASETPDKKMKKVKRKIPICKRT